MQKTLSFDLAIEILEIVDISKVSLDELSRITKKAKIRWHPDRIAQYKDEEEIAKYTHYFQLIAPAAEMVESYLRGEHQAGEKFEREPTQEVRDPAEVIRENAPDMQANLRDLWERVRQSNFKHTVQEVVLSDGFRLKDLLRQDFKEDLAGLSIISLVCGLVLTVVIGTIVQLMLPPLGVVVLVFGGLQALACLLGFLPLSRFWLPEKVQEIMLWFINLGLTFFHWISRNSEGTRVVLQLLVGIPVLLSYLVKYLVLFPLYELAKLIVGDRVVGVVKESVNYYAGGAEWYIEQLMTKAPYEMSEKELYDLSYLYGEFQGVKVG